MSNECPRDAYLIKDFVIYDIVILRDAFSDYYTDDPMIYRYKNGIETYRKTGIDEICEDLKASVKLVHERANNKIDFLKLEIANLEKFKKEASKKSHQNIYD